MPESHQREWIIPYVPCLQTKLCGAWHSSSGSGLWGGMLPRNKGPILAGPCDGTTETSSYSTFKLVQVKKNSCAQPQSHSDVKTAAYWSWNESYQLMSSWSFLPGKVRWMPPLVLSQNLSQYISEYQCINICREDHVWSLRGSQLHALLMFLPKRSLLLYYHSWK